MNTQLADKEKHLKKLNDHLYDVQEELKDQKAQADERDKKLKADRKAQNQIIKQKSDEKAEQMKKDFLTKWGAWTYIFGAYGFLVTFLMGFTSDAFKSDFGAFWGGIRAMFNLDLNTAFKWSYGWAQGIENAVGKWCVENLVGFMIALIPLVIFAILIALAIAWFIEHQADRISAIIGMVSLALLIFLSPYLKWNTMTLWVVVNIVGAIVRFFLVYHRARKSSYY